jgi:hypothetical protein
LLEKKTTGDKRLQALNSMLRLFFKFFDAQTIQGFPLSRPA